MDQHAAHERIMYEKVKANYYDEGERDEQFLLLPDVISLTHKEMIIAKENVDMFNRAGFSFEEFGENTIKLMSVPSMCEDMNTKQLYKVYSEYKDLLADTLKLKKRYDKLSNDLVNTMYVEEIDKLVEIIEMCRQILFE
jgi:DNA mismatch repair ATPase MutL